MKTFLDTLPLALEKQIEPPSTPTRMGPDDSSSESESRVADSTVKENLETRKAS